MTDEGDQAYAAGGDADPYRHHNGDAWLVAVGGAVLTALGVVGLLALEDVWQVDRRGGPAIFPLALSVLIGIGAVVGALRKIVLNSRARREEAELAEADGNRERGAEELHDR